MRLPLATAAFVLVLVGLIATDFPGVIVPSDRHSLIGAALPDGRRDDFVGLAASWLGDPTPGVINGARVSSRCFLAADLI